jgi:small subunit ribosomal protein S2
MKKYIFAERNGIHIIDLQKTIQAIKRGYDAVQKVVSSGKTVLFCRNEEAGTVGNPKRSRALRTILCEQPLARCMLTNFSTIRKSIQRLKKIERMEVDGTFNSLTKKEIASLIKEKTKLEKNLGGIKRMTSLPGVFSSWLIPAKRRSPWLKPSASESP